MDHVHTGVLYPPKTVHRAGDANEDRNTTVHTSLRQKTFCLMRKQHFFSSSVIVNKDLDKNTLKLTLH